MSELNTLSPKKWVASYSGLTPTIDSSDGVLVGDFVIDSSTTPYRVWKCEKNTIGSPVWVPLEDLTKSMSGTGLITGGTLSINVDTTKFNVAAGVGYIIDNSTNPEAPVITKVVWSTKTAQTTPYLATNPRTEVLIDSSGNLVTQTSVSQSDYRDYIYIGKVVHNNLTTINAVNTTPYVIYNASLKALDIAYALGSVNINGNIYSANGANLNLNKNSGEIYRTGSNYVNSKKIPNIYTSSEATALGFRYRYQNGSGGFTTGSLVTAVDPDNYDDGSGTLQPVPTGTPWQIQRIYLYAGTGNTYITYGQDTYAKLVDAQSAIPMEEPIIDPILASEGVLRCYMVVKKGSTVLNNIAYAYFKSAGKLGEPMGGGAAGGDVVGPSTSTDNSIARFDGITGKLLQDGANSTIDDSGNATFAGTILGKTAIVTATTTYNATSSNCVILSDATGAGFTINLPAVATSTGIHLFIKKIDSTANVVTVDANASELIDGQLTQPISGQWNCMEIVCNGTAWYIV